MRDYPPEDNLGLGGGSHLVSSQPTILVDSTVREDKLVVKLKVIILNDVYSCFVKDPKNVRSLVSI